MSLHRPAASGASPRDAGFDAALTQLRGGGMVILLDDEREYEGDLAFAACHCTVEDVNLCLDSARGLLCLVLDPRDAERLGVRRLRGNGLDPFSTPFGMPISVPSAVSAVSAQGRAETIHAAARPTSTAADFIVPGHVSTLLGNPRGLLGRRGHTEAVLDLLRMATMPGPGVLCEILTPRGEIAGEFALSELAAARSLPLVRVRDIAARSGVPGP